MDMYLLKFPYRKILKPLALKLAWIHPDVLSYTAVIVAAVTGWCFYKAADHPFLLIVAIILIFLRMTLNTMDGVIAIHRNHLSLKGEIVNALPDRYSDIFLVAGITLSPLCRNWLGLAALGTMFLVSYAGILGKALTVEWQHHGPMGKVERLIILMVFALIQFFFLPGKHTFTLIGITATPMEWAMGIMVVLGQYTIFRRVNGQLRQIHFKEALEHLSPDRNYQKAIVVFDTVTGNTRQVAQQIAHGLGCSAKLVTEIADLSGYTLVVLGSPNIRKHPTTGLQIFQRQTPLRPPMMAVFATYGLPLWGPITASRCMKYIVKTWDMKAIAHFSCPGYHKKYKTFKGRPGKEDLLSAFLFGLKLSKKLEKYERHMK